MHEDGSLLVGARSLILVRMKRLSWVGCVLAAALLSGCHSTESKLVGTWKDTNGTTLELKADHSFEMKPPPTSPMAVPAAGKWTLDERKVKLDVITVSGKPKEQGVSDVVDKFASVARAMGQKPEELKKLALERLQNISLELQQDDKTLALNQAGAPTTFTKTGS